jgi:beta-N-acetylhexosaminidase
MRSEGPGGNGGGGEDWFGGDEDWLEIDTAERDAIRKERRELERAARGGWEEDESTEGPPEPSSEDLREALQVDREADPPTTGERRRLRDDPFTPAKVSVPGERRSRRRDMPAKVRRRQVAGIGVLVAAVIIGGIVLLSGGDDKSEPTPLKKIVGQTVVGRVGKGGPDERMLRSVKKGRIGGVIVEPRNEATLQQDVETLQAAADRGDNPPLLVMIDQEGGPVKRLRGPPEVSPAQLGDSGDADQAHDEGEKTGEYLSGLGVNVDLAPVLDVATPITPKSIASRTFGDDPDSVSELGVGFAEGLQSGGVAATAKHFPGLGRATTSTDDGPVTVAAPPEELDAALQPFKDAADSGVDLMMVSSASYPGYGADKPAVLAPQVVNDLLRDEVGFDGLVITDDLETDAITDGHNADRAAVGALSAGNDLVLFATSADGASRAFNTITKAVKEGRLDRSVVEDAYDRIKGFKGDL